LGRQDEYVGIAVSRPFVLLVKWTREQNAPGKSELRNQQLKPPTVSVALIGTGQHKDRIRIGSATSCKRPEQQVRALLRNQPPQKKHHFGISRDSQFSAETGNREIGRAHV